MILFGEHKDLKVCDVYCLVVNKCIQFSFVGLGLLTISKNFCFDFRKYCNLFTNTNVITTINYSFLLDERNYFP